MTVFDHILTADVVEQHALETLQTWLPTYLREVERQTGRDPNTLPAVRSWKPVNIFERWPEDQLPAVLLVSPGLIGTPEKEGDGYYRARWSLGIGVVVSARDAATTNSLAKVYAAAVRATILQHQSLGGHSRGVGWVDEKYDDLPAEKGRTLAAGQNIFWVEYAQVVSTKGGPIQPVPPDDEPPPEDWPTVETADTTIESEAIA